MSDPTYTKVTNDGYPVTVTLDNPDIDPDLFDDADDDTLLPPNHLADDETLLPDEEED